MQKPIRTELSVKDRQLLELMCAGDCFKEIGFKLDKTRNAVSMHFTRVRLVLGARTVAHAITLYVEKHRKP